MATIDPGDILITGDHVLHVTATETTKTLTGETLTVTGTTAEGKTITGAIDPNDSFRHIPNVSDIEAENYFDIERRRDAIYEEASNNVPRALRNYWHNTPQTPRPGRLSLTDPNSAGRTHLYLDNAEEALKNTRQWVAMKRDEYLETLDKMLTAHNTKPTYTAPVDTNEKVTIKKRTFWVGYIYKLSFRTPEAGYMSRTAYARVDRVTKTKAYATFGNTKTGYITTNPGDSWYSLKAVVDGKEYYIQGWADALPTGSFQEIETYRKNRAAEIDPEQELKNIYLNTFAGENTPTCMESRYFVEKEVGHWWGTYEERRAKSLNEIYKMLFGIEKSLRHIQWVRSQIADFYKDAQ
mgnify:CR=1 FL=1|jgi:hypothetical protein